MRSQSARDRVRQVPFGWMIQNLQQRIKRVFAADISCQNSGLHSHNRIVIVGSSTQQFDRVVKFFMPKTQLCYRGSPRMMVFAAQQFLQQRCIGLVDAAINPNGFQLMVSKTRIAFIQSGHPWIQRRADFVFVAFTQFSSDPISNTRFGALQRFK